MNKFKYQHYDYSFLYRDKVKALRFMQSFASKLIGFDLVDAHPTDKPLGLLYYMDFKA